MIKEPPAQRPQAAPIQSTEQDQLSIERTDTLFSELVNYIENVVWGFEKGVRYRIFERRPTLTRLLPPGFFLLLRKSGNLIGTLFGLPKKVSLGDGSVANALYVSVLSILPEEYGNGYAKRLVNEVHAEDASPDFEYAYVEDLNVPSAAVFKAQGYESIGRFYAMTFNRLRPKQSTRVAPLEAQQAGFIRSLLAELYKDHALADFEMSLHPDHYWVLRDHGKIIAGAQVEEEVWSITGMPGPDGWFAVSVLPRLPLLNRVLNPKSIPVLKLGNLYMSPGHEKEFMELVEHLTQYYHKKLALAYLDKRSPVYQRLKKAAWFGCFNPLFETPVTIWARFKGIEAKTIDMLKERPFVISPLDIS